jgi:hypothetical protein
VKVIELHIENVKRLTAVDIKPAGPLVTIAGANGAGKSSVLDSIAWALGGMREAQAEPIRRGEERATIKLDLGELTVTRKFTRSGSTLVVESADGARYTSPQSMLDAMLGELAFDPLEFSRMPPKEQAATLRRLVKLDVDLDELARLDAADVARRTESNRAARAALASADAIAERGEPEPMIDITALSERVTSAAAHNDSIAKRQARRDALANDIEMRRLGLPKVRDEIAEIDRQIASLNAKRAELALIVELGSASIDDDAAKLANAEPLPAPIDVADAVAELNRAGAENAARELRNDARRRRLEFLAAARKHEAESRAISDAIEGRERQRRDALARAEMPIAGLEFDESGVRFRKPGAAEAFPLAQCSSAEQLAISASIAMAMNPKLRILRIKDGSLLDDNGLAMLERLAAERDFQVWIERVDTSGKFGIVIRDGTVAADPEPETLPATESAFGAVEQVFSP